MWDKVGYVVFLEKFVIDPSNFSKKTAKGLLYYFFNCTFFILTQFYFNFSYNSVEVVSYSDKGVTYGNKGARGIKQQVRSYSTCTSKQKDNDLNMKVISGFVDGEGCFSFIVYKESQSKTGWRVKLIFKIALHLRDKDLLELIKNKLGVGNITKHGPQSVEYRVSSTKDLGVIIKFLDKNTFITHKYADYIFFREAYQLIVNKEHLSEQGVRKFGKS